MTDPLDSTQLTPAERALTDEIAGRRDEIVALACDLIRFDTQSREEPTSPARQDAALQAYLGERLRASGADVDIWEPGPAEVENHPLTPPEGIGFAGRPQLAAKFAGTGGGRSLLLNGHIDVVTARMEDGWTHDPFDPLVGDGRIVGRGSCDMKGGIASMVVAAEALVRTGLLRGDVTVCTNTDEECGGWGALACARHGVSADFAIIPEPSGLEVWPACRGSAYCTVTIPGRAGHTEQEHAHFRSGGAVNAIEKTQHFLAGVDRLRLDWRSRPESRHPLLPMPDIVCSRLVADAGWIVTIPGRATLMLAVLVLPGQADQVGWTSSVQEEVETYLRRWCDADPWLAENPPVFDWHTEVNPSETPVDTPSVRALLGANAALGLPLKLGGLGSWYDGATFALEANTPALMYGPSHIDWAHTVGEYVPIDDLVHCAQGIAVAGLRLCG